MKRELCVRGASPDENQRRGVAIERLVLPDLAIHFHWGGLFFCIPGGSDRLSSAIHLHVELVVGSGAGRLAQITRASFFLHGVPALQLGILRGGQMEI